MLVVIDSQMKHDELLNSSYTSIRSNLSKSKK